MARSAPAHCSDERERRRRQRQRRNPQSEPTIIGKATRQMLVSQEEQFSPILAIFEFDTEEEVVKQANDTSMGLASCKCHYP